MSTIKEVICDGEHCGARKGPNDKWIVVSTADSKTGEAAFKVTKGAPLSGNQKDYCSFTCVASALEDFINEERRTRRPEDMADEIFNTIESKR